MSYIITPESREPPMSFYDDYYGIDSESAATVESKVETDNSIIIEINDSKAESKISCDNDTLQSLERRVMVCPSTPPGNPPESNDWHISGDSFIEFFMTASFHITAMYFFHRRCKRYLSGHIQK